MQRVPSGAAGLAARRRWIVILGSLLALVGVGLVLDVDVLGQSLQLSLAKSIPATIVSAVSSEEPLYEMPLFDYSTNFPEVEDEGATSLNATDATFFLSVFETPGTRPEGSEASLPSLDVSVANYEPFKIKVESGQIRRLSGDDSDSGDRWALRTADIERASRSQAWGFLFDEIELLVWNLEGIPFMKEHVSMTPLFPRLEAWVERLGILDVTKVARFSNNRKLFRGKRGQGGSALDRARALLDGKESYTEFECPHHIGHVLASVHCLRGDDSCTIEHFGENVRRFRASCAYGIFHHLSAIFMIQRLRENESSGMSSSSSPSSSSSETSDTQSVLPSLSRAASDQALRQLMGRTNRDICEDAEVLAWFQESNQHTGLEPQTGECGHGLGHAYTAVSTAAMYMREVDVLTVLQQAHDATDACWLSFNEIKPEDPDGKGDAHWARDVYFCATGVWHQARTNYMSARALGASSAGFKAATWHEIQDICKVAAAPGACFKYFASESTTLYARGWTEEERPPWTSQRHVRELSQELIQAVKAGDVRSLAGETERDREADQSYMDNVSQKVLEDAAFRAAALTPWLMYCFAGLSPTDGAFVPITGSCVAMPAKHVSSNLRLAAVMTALLVQRRLGADHASHLSARMLFGTFMRSSSKYHSTLLDDKGNSHSLAELCRLFADHSFHDECVRDVQTHGMFGMGGAWDMYVITSGFEDVQSLRGRKLPEVEPLGGVDANGKPMDPDDVRGNAEVSGKLKG